MSDRGHPLPPLLHLSRGGRPFVGTAILPPARYGFDPGKPRELHDVAADLYPDRVLRSVPPRVRPDRRTARGPPRAGRAGRPGIAAPDCGRARPRGHRRPARACGQASGRALDRERLPARSLQHRRADRRQGCAPRGEPGTLRLATSYLGVDGFGEYAIVLSLAPILLVFADLGFRPCSPVSSPSRRSDGTSLRRRCSPSPGRLGRRRARVVGRRAVPPLRLPRPRRARDRLRRRLAALHRHFRHPVLPGRAQARPPRAAGRRHCRAQPRPRSRQ